MQIANSPPPPGYFNGPQGGVGVMGGGGGVDIYPPAAPATAAVEVSKVTWCTEGLRFAGCCAKLLCGCVCCFAFVGPLIMIVGIVIIVMPNSRAEDIKAFNDAGKAFDGQPIRLLENTPTRPSKIHTGELTILTEQVSPKGDLDGVDLNVFSTLLKTTAAFQSDAQISFNIANTDVFTRNIPKVSDKRVEMECTSPNGCSLETMRARCIDRGGGVGTYSGSGCSSESTSCGTCTFPAFLERYCVVIEAKPESLSSATVLYAQHSTYRSCYYPFGANNQFFNSPNDVDVQFNVRLSSDPFIVLQRVTEGKEDFGITVESQRVTGAVLLGVGGFVLLIMGAVAFFVYRMVDSANTTRMHHQMIREQRRLERINQQQGMVAAGVVVASAGPAPGMVISPHQGVGGAAYLDHYNARNTVQLYEMAPTTTPMPMPQQSNISIYEDTKDGGGGGGAYAAQQQTSGAAPYTQSAGFQRQHQQQQPNGGSNV